MKKLVYIIALLFVAGACKDGPQLMPNVTGKAGEVLIVADKVYTDGEFGKAVREVLTADYPAIPQVEPLFNLSTIHWAGYTKIFESFRNQIKLRVSHEHPEAKITVQHDVYAAPQLIINIIGPDDESVTKLIYDQRDKLVELIEQAERNRFLANAKRYENTDSYSAVLSRFGGSMTFPAGFKATKLKNDKFIWLINNERTAMLGVMVYSYPYTGAADFELNNMIAADNAILKKNMPSSEDNSYMQISTVLEPSLRFVKYNDIHFAEMRGLWEVENGFMGGPFVSHSFLDKEGKNIIVTTAFVYAPAKDKRNFIRQTESILYSWEWDNRPETSK